MKKYLFYALLLISVTSTLQAQQKDSITVYRNDIGFNTTILLNGILNTPTYGTYPDVPLDLLYKRQLKSNKALRLGINASIDNQTQQTNLTTGQDNQFQSVELNLIAGKEWQSILSKRWIWYGGADIIPQLTYSKAERVRTEIVEYQSFSTSYGISLRPFLGIRFAVSKRLYLSTEAFLNANYSTKKYSDATYNVSTNEIITQNSTTATNYSVKFKPASGIFIFYRF